METLRRCATWIVLALLVVLPGCGSEGSDGSGGGSLSGGTGGGPSALPAGIHGPAFTAEGTATFTLGGGMSGVWTVDREEETERETQPVAVTTFPNVFPAQSGSSASYTLLKVSGKGTAYVIKADVGGTIHTHRTHVLKVGAISSFVFESAVNPDIRVWIVIPSSRTSDSHLVSIHHGNGRTARGYLSRWTSWAAAHNYIAYAPEFREADYSSAAYHRGNVLSGSTLNPESKWTFTMVEDLHRRMLAGFGTKDTKVDMWGHSAGGQFVHRFSFFKPNAPVRYYIPANAGYYTTPDLIGSGACAYAYSVWHPSFSTSSADLTAWTSRTMVIMRGTLDTDPNDPELVRGTCADKQGLHRYSRAGHFHARGKAVGNPSFAWHLKDVKNVGHSSTGMSQAPDGAQKFLENPAAFGVPVLPRQ